MTDLETKIDQEVGLDTEHERVTYLKYVNYGRQLVGEANYAQVFADIDQLNEKVWALQKVVEDNDEDAAMAALTIKYSAPEFKELVAQFQLLLDTVDKKHALILNETRDAGYKALKEKYLEGK